MSRIKAGMTKTGRRITVDEALDSDGFELIIAKNEEEAQAIGGVLFSNDRSLLFDQIVIVYLSHQRIISSFTEGALYPIRKIPDGLRHEAKEQHIKELLNRAGSIYITSNGSVADEMRAFDIVDMFELNIEHVDLLSIASMDNKGVMAAYDNSRRINDDCIFRGNIQETYLKLLEFEIKKFLDQKISPNMNGDVPVLLALQELCRRQSAIDKANEIGKKPVIRLFAHSGVDALEVDRITSGKAAELFGSLRFLASLSDPDASNDVLNKHRLTSFKLIEIRNGRDSDFEIDLNASSANKHLEALRSCRYEVVSVERVKILGNQMKPYNLISLLLDCQEVLKMEPLEALRVIQGMYYSGFITQPSLDGVYVEDRHAQQFKEYTCSMGSECVKTLAPDNGEEDGISTTSKSLNGIDTYWQPRAIMATDINKVPDIKAMSDSIYQIYNLVWMRSLAFVMSLPTSERIKVVVKASVDGSNMGYIFEAIWDGPYEGGYISVWDLPNNTEDLIRKISDGRPANNPDHIGRFVKGEILNRVILLKDNDKVIIPPFHSEASLLAMVQSQVGEIDIEKFIGIIRDGYIKPKSKLNGFITTDERGKAICDIMKEYLYPGFSGERLLELRASVSDMVLDTEEEDFDLEDFLAEYTDPVIDGLAKASEDVKGMVHLHGGNRMVCPTCNSSLLLSHTPFGDYFICSKCNAIYNREIAIGLKCPKCGNGEICVSPNGGHWKCNNPSCTFATFLEPQLELKCSCGAPLGAYRDGRGDVVYSCLMCSTSYRPDKSEGVKNRLLKISDGLIKNSRTSGDEY